MKNIDTDTLDTTEQSGLTLIELLITIAIVSVVAAMASPSFSTMVEKNRLESETNRLLTHIELARDEAINRNETTAYLAKGTNWIEGYDIFADLNNNGQFDSGSDALIQQEENAAENLKVYSQTNLISFTHRGLLNASSNIELYLCQANQESVAMKITINRIGRAKAAYMSDSTHCKDEPA